MIKVRILRTGLPFGVATTGIVALSGISSAGCAVEPEGEDATADESAYTTMNAGTGVFLLQYAYGTQSGWSFALTESSTDEYVRAREKMTFAIPAHFLWSSLYPDQATPDDLGRLDKLSVKVKASYVRKGAVYASSTASATGRRGTMTYDRAVTTSQITIGSKAESVRFELTITDAGAPTAKKTISDFLEVPVIGGALPDKTLLFDSLGAAMRSRVLEGGNVVAGANLAIGYTDWRAGTLVDAGRIDRNIGTQRSFGRFGPIEMPILGDLEYEVSWVYAIDGVWQNEAPLTANAKSRFLPPFGRTAYEGGLAVPAGAKNVEIAFHVKTYLVARYGGIFGQVVSKRFQEGERMLVRDQWDNENGRSFDNWDFPTEKR